jgi:hypothetical protein
MIYFQLKKEENMRCVICNKTEDESYENHEKRLDTLTSSYTRVLKQLPRECTWVIVEYIIGNNPWYSMEIWNWVCYTSYFEKDYDYTITCKDACRSCLEASTLEYYNIHGTTPCKLSDYLEASVDENEIRGESPNDLSIFSHKNIYFRDFVCDGWRNTPPFYQKNLLGEDFITL